MKSIKLLLTIISLALSGFLAETEAQCVALFSDTNWSANTVFYTNLTSGATNGTVYSSFSFPGGTPSSYSGFYVDTISVYYPNAGYYGVCLTITDSLTNCTSTTCDSIYVGWANNITLGFNNINTACGACNGSSVVSATGGTGPYTYQWSNGATTAAVSGLCAGTYYVTVMSGGQSAVGSATITGSGGVNVGIQSNSWSFCDSALVNAVVTSGTAPYIYNWSNGWTANYSVYGNNTMGGNLAVVTVTDANGCTGIDSMALNFAPAFTINATSTNETCLSCCDGAASVSASGGPSNQPFEYLWSNGANTSAVTGLCPGWYSVTVTDTLYGCSHVDYINIAAFSCPSLSGTITQGFNTQVYLIQENNGVLSAVDSIQTDSNGGYWFSNVCPGTYYVKASLLPNHPLYSYFVPTYYINSSLWGMATAIMVSGNTTAIDINMLTGANLGGPGFIGGLVSQGANRGEGDPIVGVQVNLLDENDEFLAFTHTNANGEYGFEGLAYGSYKVYVEWLNFEAFPFVVNIDAETEEVGNRNFVVEGNMVKPVTPTGINDASVSTISIFPNPAQDILTVNGKINGVEIFNILGEKVFEKSNITAENANLDVSKLTSGQYIVKLKQGEETTVISLIIQ